MRLTRLAASALLAIVAITTPAQCATFDFWYAFTSNPVGGSFTANGTLTTGDVPDFFGGYPVLSISGTRTAYGVSETITGLVSPAVSWYPSDNLLYLSLPFLDDLGLSFTVDGVGNNGQGEVNVFYAGYGYTEAGADVGSGAFMITAQHPGVPEPSAALLIGCGLVCLAALGRKAKV